MQPISNLKLPASHDSGAYKVDYSHPMKGNTLVRRVSVVIQKVPIIGKWVGSIIEDWTKTQQSSIYDQLKSGIRVLDLRVALDPTDGRYYISHTFCCIPLKDALAQIKKFLAEYPEEIVMVEMCPDHEHRAQTSKKEHTDKILSEVQRQIGDYLHPLSDISQLTLKQMTTENKRAIFAYSKAEPPTEFSPNIWLRFMSSKWTNTSNMCEKLKAPLEPSLLLEVSATLTPNKSDVVKSIFNRFNPFSSRKDLKSLTMPMNQTIAKKLKEDPIWQKAQVISADQFEKTAIIETVIRKNRY